MIMINPPPFYFIYFIYFGGTGFFSETWFLKVQNLVRLSRVWRPRGVQVNAAATAVGTRAEHARSARPTYSTTSRPAGQLIIIKLFFPYTVSTVTVSLRSRNTVESRCFLHFLLVDRRIRIRTFNFGSRSWMPKNLRIQGRIRDLIALPGFCPDQPGWYSSFIYDSYLRVNLRILCNRFEFHKKEWAHVSAEAKDLIAGLLVKVRLCDDIVRTVRS